MPSCCSDYLCKELRGVVCLPFYSITRQRAATSNQPIIRQAITTTLLPQVYSTRYAMPQSKDMKPSTDNSPLTVPSRYIIEIELVSLCEVFINHMRPMQTFSVKN